ncbi:MAG: hydantoinase/oxoprolinase family protein [Alphaproteobacteria bacterium]|nr:hydantoinase/oxoprolinase family protein [Alphaproteobacteria bacterium]
MLRLGCDIGGTFTDFVLIDDQSAKTWQHKVLTTRDDPTVAVIAGLQDLLPLAEGAELTEVIHGTTLVINALIERKGAPTALVTTAGFRDVLEIAREYRYEAYSASPVAPPALIPRERRFEVEERMLATGAALQEVSVESIDALLPGLRAQGIESVAIALLHSYQNRAHEDRVAEILQEKAPELVLSLSTDVLPTAGEYERTSTTAINAYVKPLSSRYLKRLEERLQGLEAECRLFVMFSEGGLATAETAARFPARMVESGPVAGAIAAADSAKNRRIPNLLYFDMGGTTAKGCLVSNGQVVTTREYEVAREDRFKEGSGLPLHLPVVDMIEIGAGGGSLARKSSLGLLQVGPQSMGSSPGPACYDNGGTMPTVTDADLLLGYMAADRFLGGQLRLRTDAATAAFERLAEELGMDTVAAAWGVHDVVNENMATAFDRYAVEHGEDLSQYTMMAAGGAGPVHAYWTAKKLGISRVLIPPQPSVFSAMGMVNAPFAFELTETRVVQVDEALPEVAATVLASLRRRVLEQLPKWLTTSAKIRCAIAVRFVGQKFTIDILDLADDPSQFTASAIRKRFESQYDLVYGRSISSGPLEIVDWTLRAEQSREAVAGAREDIKSERHAAAGTRRAYFGPEHGFRDCRVTTRHAMEFAEVISGPVLVEEPHSTLVVGPEGSVSVAQDGTLEVNIAEGGSSK